jgi:hypothetical protein
MFKHWRKILTLGYPLAVLCWTLPAGYFPFKENLDRIIAHPFLTLNLWQAWDMFAPDPRSEDIWVGVTVTEHSGQKHEIVLTDMLKMTYFERWQKERWRKYFNDHLRTDAKQNLWAPYAAYALRTLRQQGLNPAKLELTRWWRTAIHPTNPELRADRRVGGWNHYTFYTWNDGTPAP